MIPHLPFPCTRTALDNTSLPSNKVKYLFFSFHHLHSIHSLSSVSTLPACFQAHILSDRRFFLVPFPAFRHLASLAQAILPLLAQAILPLPPCCLLLALALSLCFSVSLYVTSQRRHSPSATALDPLALAAHLNSVSWPMALVLTHMATYLSFAEAYHPSLPRWQSFYLHPGTLSSGRHTLAALHCGRYAHSSPAAGTFSPPRWQALCPPRRQVRSVLDPWRQVRSALPSGKHSLSSPAVGALCHSRRQAHIISCPARRQAHFSVAAGTLSSPAAGALCPSRQQALCPHQRQALSVLPGSRHSVLTSGRRSLSFPAAGTLSSPAAVVLSSPAVGALCPPRRQVLLGHTRDRACFDVGL